jgi:hypothetical protein
MTLDELRLSPLSAAGVRAFRAWVRGRIVGEATARACELADHAPKRVRAALIRRAHALVDGGHAEAAATKTPEGVAVLLWLCAQAQHPELTQADVDAMVTLSNWRQAAAMLDDAGEPAPSPADAATPATPTVDQAPYHIHRQQTIATQAQRRRQVFDAMCADKGVKPADLANLASEELLALWAKHGGKPENPEPMTLVARAIEYAGERQAA